MTGLIPLNRRNSIMTRPGNGFDDFYNMVDDFFSDNMFPSRSLARDTFKIDIEETDSEYLIYADLPGIKREEIGLEIIDKSLCIDVKKTEEADTNEKNYIHKERRTTSMSRRIRLADANNEDISAKLVDGVLSITIPKADKNSLQKKIEIE